MDSKRAVGGLVGAVDADNSKVLFILSTVAGPTPSSKLRRVFTGASTSIMGHLAVANNSSSSILASITLDAPLVVAAGDASVAGIKQGLEALGEAVVVGHD